MKTIFLAFLAFDAASIYYEERLHYYEEILHNLCYDKDVRMEFRLSCNQLLYGILSNENSKEYPLSNILGIVSDYSSSCGYCTIPQDLGTHFSSTERNFTYSNCDCSDPKNYNFKDEGRFEIFQGQIMSY